ncbi:MAG: hypothetical protein V1896_00020 [Candidatus Zambryskibacteria bacterium]
MKREYAVPETEFKSLYSYVTNETSEEELGVDVSGSVEDALKILETYVKEIV